MNLVIFRHLWGVTEDWEPAFARFKAAGYGGIESRMPGEGERARFRRLLDAHDFEYIAQVFTEGRSVGKHLDSLREQVEAAKTLRPRLINAHSGEDGFSEADSRKFFAGALEIEQAAAVPIAHETHRGRIFYNPWITQRMLGQFPTLKLGCDFSHWVCVCERLLGDLTGLLAECAEHCLHLHARVGYEEGPQVPDPRAPEYRSQVEAHERWWQMIWRAQEQAGFAGTTATPEFGPPNYLHTLPFTQAPVSNLAEICDWQARRLAGLFEDRPAGEGPEAG